MKWIATVFIMILPLSALGNNFSNARDNHEAGIGIEYTFGTSKGKLDLFAYSGAEVAGKKYFNKVTFQQILEFNRLSCVPREDDPDGSCSGGWVGPAIYIMALPVSIYLYKKMLGVD